MKIKPRKCQDRKCRREFQPVTEWQKFCCVKHRQAEMSRRRTEMIRKAERILEAQDNKGAA